MRILKSLAVAATALMLSHVAASAQQAPIKIGVALALTGNLADSAKHYGNAVKLWQEQTNSAGGLLGRQVELVIYDERSDPATATRLYEKYITEDKVDLLIAPFGTASTATVSAVAEKHKRVLINGGGASESIHRRGFKYLFQTAARISSYIDGVVPTAQKHGFKSMIVISRDYAAGRDLAKAVEAQAKDAGIELKLVEFFPSGTADFSSHIAKVRQINPDVWLSIGYPNEAIEMVRQLRAANYMPKMFIHNGVSQEDFLKAAGKDAEHFIGLSLYETPLKTKGNVEFIKAFESKFGYEPGYYAAFGYTAAMVLGEAVKKTGSLDQDKLRETLSQMELETVMGKHKIDPATGMQLGVKGLLVQVKNGKREIIFPEELKTTEAIIPLPAWDKR